MVLTTIATVVIAFVLLYGVATLVQAAGISSGRFFGWTLALQQVALAIFAAALFQNGIVGTLITAGLLALPLVVRIFAYLWFWRMGKKMLQGEYGEETKWAMELAKEGDDEFIEAADRLSELEMNEIGIIADSKEELRELVIEENES
jgi:hypothetical protein